MKDPGKKVSVIFFGRFTESEILSGPEKTAKRLFEKYSAGSEGIFVQYFFDGRNYSARQKLFGKKKAVTGNGSFVYTLGLFRIHAFLLKQKPAIVHLAAFERFAVILFLYKLFNHVRIIYNCHGIIAYENSEIKKVSNWQKLKDKFSERLFLKYSDKIILPSEFVMDIAEKYYSINENKVIILPNGIDREFAATTRESKINTQLKAVLILKNEFSKSGASFFSNWIAGFKGKYSLDFYIIGSKQIIDLYNFPGVTILGPMNPKELADFYSDKDIFLQLNEYETFSIAAAEAMAAGLIPIVTKQTGFSRYIENGYNGFIIEYGNANKLDSAVRSLISAPPEQRKQLSQNARIIYKELNWNTVYEMYYNVYKEMSR